MKITCPFQKGLVRETRKRFIGLLVGALVVSLLESYICEVFISQYL